MGYKTEYAAQQGHSNSGTRLNNNAMVPNNFPPQMSRPIAPLGSCAFDPAVVFCDALAVTVLCDAVRVPAAESDIVAPCTVTALENCVGVCTVLGDSAADCADGPLDMFKEAGSSTGGNFASVAARWVWNSWRAVSKSGVVETICTNEPVLSAPLP